MATFVFRGTTQQYGINHQNKVVALKVDINANPKVTKLAEATADVDGSFVLQWADWDGRVIVGAVDDGPLGTTLNAVFRDFVVGSDAADVQITQAPVYVVSQDAETGASVTAAPIFPIINNVNTGLSVTAVPVFVIERLNYNLNGDPGSTDFNLTVVVN